VACGFWNPAGLSGLRGLQVEDQYTLLAYGQELNYLGVANSFRDHFAYGLSFLYYTAGGDLEARQGPSIDPDSLFGDLEMTLIASVAFPIDRRWSSGLSAKLFLQSLGSYTSGLGFGSDVGIQYRWSPSTTLGFVVQDIYSSLTYNSSMSSTSVAPEQLIPPTLRVGVAHHQEDLKLKANGDLEWSSDLGLRPRVGVEWRAAGSLALRGGAWAGNLTGGASGGSLAVHFTAGVGLLLRMNGDLLEFDYSMLEDRLSPGAILHQASIVGKFL
jgi:hypothetical protein